MSKSKRQLKLLEDETSIGFEKVEGELNLTDPSNLPLPFQTLDQSVKLVSGLIASILLCTAIWAAFQIPNLNTSYSVKQFFPSGHPLFKQAEEIQNTFLLNENAGFLIVLQLPSERQGDWLKPNHIELLKKITSSFKNHADVVRALSLSEVNGLFESDQELSIGSIFENLDPENWNSYIQSKPIIAKQLITRDFRSTLIAIEPSDLSPENLVHVSQELRAIVSALDPEIQVEIGGISAIQGEFAETLLSELKIYLLLCLFIFGVVFSFLIRGKSSLALMVGCLILGNLLSLGIMSYLKISFSVLLTTLPIILSIAIVSLFVHSLHLWAQRLQWNRPKSLYERWVMSLSVLKEMALANFLGSLTTAIGFLSLATSSVPLLKEYGIVVGLAVMGGWALTQVYLVSFMVFINPRLKESASPKTGWILAPIQGYKFSLISISVGTLIFAVLGLQIEFSGRLFDDLPKDAVSRQVTEKIDQHFGGVVPYDLVIESQSEQFFKSMKSLVALKSFTDEIEKDVNIGSALSYPNLLNDNSFTSQEKLAENLFIYTLSSENPLNQYLTEDGRKVRLSVRFKDAPGAEIKSSRARITELAHKYFPNAKLTEGGLSVRAHTINEEVSRSLIFGFLESLIFIGLFLVCVFRSLKWALVACIPNLIPPIVLLGSLTYFETPVKPTIALIFSIALGLAFNNTVYFLGRLKSITKGLAPTRQQLNQALLQEAYPCTSETLLMFFGFMIFLSSTFQINQTFGVYMLLSIVSGFIGDLIFLPAMLAAFPNMLGKSKVHHIEISEEKDISQVQKVAASVVIIFTIMMASVSTPAFGAPSAEIKDLLTKVQAKVETKDDQATIKMIISEPNGQTKEREMNLVTLRDDQFYARVKILSPADVKGTGFLAHVTPTEEQQWIYVPSTKKVRRVVGGNKNAGILGSELTIEDLDPSALRSSQMKLQSKDNKKIILEVTPDKNTSPYSKVLTAISATEHLPLRTIYFKGSKQVKTVDFLDYKKVGKDIWRAQKIKVKNLENKRGTELQFSEMKSNTGVSKSEFTQNSLKFN